MSQVERIVPMPAPVPYRRCYPHLKGQMCVTQQIRGRWEVPGLGDPGEIWPGELAGEGRQGEAGDNRLVLQRMNATPPTEAVWMYD
jgi:hypothetical protein